MKFKVGDKVCYKHPNPSDNVEVGEVGTICGISEATGTYGVAFEAEDIYKHSCDGLCQDKHGWWCDENTLEPADNIVRMADGTIIGDFSTGGVIPTSEWDKLVFKNGSSIEVLPQKDNTVRGENHFCTGFRGGKIPASGELIISQTEIERTTDLLLDAWAKLGCTSFIMSPDEIKKMEEKKMPTKFTFYFNVNEGTRVDKSCNGTIPTITTSVVLDKFGDPNRRNCYSLEGEATCDKADYDMRQGVLEALANAIFDGNFEKAYDKAVKTNAFCERQDRTCHYCGKVLDTIEEKQAHEAWHIERKKARRERYLLRKRAKEIAFEEQAQKMAKEMIGEQK